MAYKELKKTYYKLHKEPFASFYSDFYSYTHIPFAFADYYKSQNQSPSFLREKNGLFECYPTPWPVPKSSCT